MNFFYVWLIGIIALGFTYLWTLRPDERVFEVLCFVKGLGNLSLAYWTILLLSGFLGLPVALILLWQRVLTEEHGGVGEPR